MGSDPNVTAWGIWGRNVILNEKKEPTVPLSGYVGKPTQLKKLHSGHPLIP